MSKIFRGCHMSKKIKDDLSNSKTRNLPNRIDKTLDWLEQSREVWKSKCIKAKSDLKVKTLKVKRLSDRKDLWKQRVKQSTKEINIIQDALEASSKEIERLKAELNSKDTEITKLKKKLSYIRRK
jgi:chromosome segregation ATPase